MASYNRMSNEIDVLKGQRARLVEERNNLPPEQVPLFSRAATDDTQTQDVPLFSRASRNFSDGNSNESIKRREAVKVAEERTKETPRGDIPFYNMNASDIALEAAIEFNQHPPNLSLIHT